MAKYKIVYIRSITGIGEADSAQEAKERFLADGVIDAEANEKIVSFTATPISTAPPRKKRRSSTRKEKSTSGISMKSIW